MFTEKSSSDFVVAEPFRWQGIMYETDSKLPAGFPQAVIPRFLHRTPPLIKLKAKPTSSNGTRKKTAKKKVEFKAKAASSNRTRKKTARKKKKTEKKTVKR